LSDFLVQFDSILVQPCLIVCVCFQSVYV
jgi:hypothetical protein